MFINPEMNAQVPAHEDSEYPAALKELIKFFEHLPEQERRENLIMMSDRAKTLEPRAGEQYDLEDVRKDEECTDTVGIFLRMEDGDRAYFAVTLGPQVQTLTKAMATILCSGLNGARIQEVLDVPADFVSRIVGANLVRLRSRTVYYVLGRMKAAAKTFLDRRRAPDSFTPTRVPDTRRRRRTS